MKKFLLIITFLACLLSRQTLFAQQRSNPDTAKIPASATFQQEAKTTYPKVVGYVSFILPIVTVNKDETIYNFNGTTSIGFPVGVNVLYSDKFGFSYEFTPTIKSGQGVSKTSNILFDPGTMFRFQHGFTIITRLAFETSGRYGFTPVFNKVYARTKDINYFVAMSLPARFGNSAPASIGLNIQFGFTFN
ncbi:hypothetical protein [Mucilaginibacter sp.]|jgi:hypothetical protein|uniref:hypothetical protein n=1 Tax=Mucilaginibacter sp. TaxID=1882438 RepID=UPI002C5457F0|nr:hypothetical protein [Mucilaginibacter sp.]HTI57439.1 hypothetical protein [Mucilaginibacter sp.]